jgi:rubredoxin
MSTRNWTICPKCKKENKGKFENSYGVVDEEEYLKLKKGGESVKETLGEHYSIRVNSDGIFSVNYRCECTVCGFSFNFENESNVLEIDKT